ncbi:hypothetical protein X975_01594, partial [Stegodyphus mimosarum]
MVIINDDNVTVNCALGLFTGKKLTIGGQVVKHTSDYFPIVQQVIRLGDYTTTELTCFVFFDTSDNANRVKYIIKDDGSITAQTTITEITNKLKVEENENYNKDLDKRWKMTKDSQSITIWLPLYQIFDFLKYFRKAITDTEECWVMINGKVMLSEKYNMDFSNKEWNKPYEVFLEIKNNRNKESRCMIDYLSYDYTEPEKLRDPNQHLLLPQHPFRLFIEGPSGCSKTNLLLNLINGFEEPKGLRLDFDALYICAKHINEPKYSKLQDTYTFFEDIERDNILKTKKLKDKREILNYDKYKKEEVFSSDLNEFITADDLDPLRKNLVFYDDCVT